MHFQFCTGKIQESLALFQQATAINPHNVANLKQVGGEGGGHSMLREAGTGTRRVVKAASGAAALA